MLNGMRPASRPVLGSSFRSGPFSTSESLTQMYPEELPTSPTSGISTVVLPVAMSNRSTRRQPLQSPEQPEPPKMPSNQRPPFSTVKPSM